MRNYKELWEAAVAAGTEKLEENIDKGGLQIDIFYADKRIKDESKEVHEEVVDLLGVHQRDISAVNLEAARREFADVLNFAAMGILECNRLIKLKNAKLCNLEGCEKPCFSRFLCEKHYKEDRKKKLAEGLKG